jgi:hypothetical protein
MKINSINTSFKAQIPNNAATKKISSVLNQAKDYDYNGQHINYENLCNIINKLLPKNSDKVIFNTCDSQYGSSYYIEGQINQKDKKQNPFSSTVYYRSGSNQVAKDILTSIINALNNPQE